MLKSLTNRCLFAVVLAVITSAFGCTVQERKVELQGSTYYVDGGLTQQVTKY